MQLEPERHHVAERTCGEIAAFVAGAAPVFDHAGIGRDHGCARTAVSTANLLPPLWNMPEKYSRKRFASMPCENGTLLPHSVHGAQMPRPLAGEPVQSGVAGPGASAVL